MRPYLLAAALAAATCSRPAPPPPEDARAPEPPLPRYWLRDAPLLGNPGGREVLHVTGPALVELLPAGRVRAVPGSAVTFEGYLPEELLHEPHGTKGLMLYAQRVVELHADHPDRPLIGRLHPGALVGVAPSGEAEGRVGLPAYRMSLPATTVLAYTDRDALGLTPAEPPAWKPKGAGRAMVIPWQRVYAGDPYARDTAEIALSDCSDIWLPEAGREASQYVRGVEITGRFEMATAAMWYYGPRTHEGLGCPLRAVSRREGVLVAIGPEGGPAEVDRIPPVYAPVMSDGPDPLEKIIEGHQTVHWLVATSTLVVCESWRFDQTRWVERALQAVLVGDNVSIPPEDLRVHPWYPVTYRRAGVQRAGMHLKWKIPENSLDEYDFTVLASSAEELIVTGQDAPQGIVAYDPVDVERWFLTRSRCEAVRREVNAVLEADGSASTRLGIHTGGI